MDRDQDRSRVSRGPAYRSTTTVTAYGLKGEETKEDIKGAFGAFGEVVDVVIHDSRCLITFSDVDGAKRAADNKKVFIRKTKAALSISMRTEQAPIRTGRVMIPNSITNSWDISRFSNEFAALLPEVTSQQDMELKERIKEMMANYSGFKTGTPREIEAINKSEKQEFIPKQKEGRVQTRGNTGHGGRTSKGDV